MIISNCEQRTEEWHALRCGIPTASNFGKLINFDGKPSKQRNKYLLSLVAEKVLGYQEEGYRNLAMEIGIEREDEARDAYELITGNSVEQVGFCMREGNIKCGCSPDGLIGEDGMLEIKCPLITTHIEYISKDKVPSAYMPQIQGQLFVTGRKWCDFMSYFPEVKPFIVRVYPIAEMFKAIERELILLTKDIEILYEKIVGESYRSKDRVRS